MKLVIALLLSGIPFISSAKEIALSFDDAPFNDSLFYKSSERTTKLIQELKNQNSGSVMIFAVACRFSETGKTLKQLNEWQRAGHTIANHSCSHPDLHKINSDEYIKDLEKADTLLKKLIPASSKFFRYPYLHEGTTTETRDQIRAWLKAHQYRNGSVSIDNDDWLFHRKLNQAKELKKSINLKAVREIYLDHILSAAAFYDDLAVKLLGRSPKHVLLLHEIDSSVLFVADLIKKLKMKGWKIIDPLEAYKDPIYLEQPKTLYANNGLIAQLAEENGLGHFAFKDSLRERLNKVLGTTDEK